MNQTRKARPQIHLRLPPEAAAAVTPRLVREVEALIRAAGPSLRVRAMAAGEGLLTAVAEAKAPATVAVKVAAILMEARAAVGAVGIKDDPVEDHPKETTDDSRAH